MANRRSRAEVEAALADPRRRHETLRSLPADVDPARAAEAVLQASSHAWRFGRSCRRLPLPVIEAVLARLREDRSHVSIFVQEAVRVDGGGSLADAWAAALQALLDLHTSYGWGTRQRRGKIAGVAADRRFVAGSQAVAVGCDPVPIDMLAVLVLDGSDASIDALMPYLVRASEERGRELDLLSLLRPLAEPGSRVAGLLGEVAALIAERNLRSPAMELARRLGIGDGTPFWFDLHLRSVPGPVTEPQYECFLRVDGRSPDWLSLQVTRRSPQGLPGATSAFGNDTVFRDDLELGACRPGDLPEWLGRAARTLRVSWDFPRAVVRTGLRGAKRAALLRMLGARQPA